MKLGKREALRGRRKVVALLPYALLAAFGCAKEPAPRGDSVSHGLPGDSRDSVVRPTRLPSASRTVLFVGTSLTAGYGLEPDSAYPAQIQQLIDSAGLP